MYEDEAGRRLTLYVQAARGTETAFRFQKEGDAATFAWIDEPVAPDLRPTPRREPAAS